MSSTVEVEPGATQESVLVAAEPFDNYEGMSSSLEEIKITGIISQSEESNDNENAPLDQNEDDSINLREEYEDQMITKDWIDRDKHIFALSFAGKPIYSR